MRTKSVGVPPGLPELRDKQTPASPHPVYVDESVAPGPAVCVQSHDTGKGANIRCAKPWMMAIQEEGMWEIAHARGPNWPNNQTGVANPYQLTLDLAYGMANWTSNEDFVLGGNYRNSSLKYDLAMDYANPMATPTNTDYLEQFEFNYFLLSQYNGSLTSAQRQQFELTYLHNAAGTSFNPNNLDDQDMYISSASIQSMLHPWGSLNSVPLTVTNNGGGSYTLSWTAPSGTTSYRIKQMNLPIVEWIGFNPKTNSFIGNPANSSNWFASTEVATGSQSTCPPPPASAGTHQTCTISGLDPSQSWDFAMKSSSAPTSSLSVSIATPQPQVRKELKEIGWTKGRELAKLARRDGQHFDCAPWVHKARHMPREDFRREVEKELTGKDEEPSELIYFKVYKSQTAVIEQALDTAARMLGSDRSRGYCLEMICADFLAGANLDNQNPETLLFSMTRFFRLLPRQQQQAFLQQVLPPAS